MLGLLDGLQVGIGGEGLAAFDDLDRLRKVGQRLSRRPTGAKTSPSSIPFLRFAVPKTSSGLLGHG